MLQALAIAIIAIQGCTHASQSVAHRPCSNWSIVDDARVIHGFETLTPEQARGAGQDFRGALYFPDLRSVTEEVAEALAATTGTSLHLCGLRDLDAASAMRLAGYRSGGDRVLCLDGLRHATPDVLRALAKTGSWGLSLNGLEKLDADGVRAFGSRATEFAHLELCGVQEFDQEAAQELRSWQVKFCYLAGLRAISPSVARAFAAARIECLVLTGLEKVSEEVAIVLGQWEQAGHDLKVGPAVRASIDCAAPKKR